MSASATQSGRNKLLTAGRQFWKRLQFCRAGPTLMILWARDYQASNFPH